MILILRNLLDVADWEVITRIHWIYKYCCTYDFPCSILKFGRGTERLSLLITVSLADGSSAIDRHKPQADHL